MFVYNRQVSYYKTENVERNSAVRTVRIEVNSKIRQYERHVNNENIFMEKIYITYKYCRIADSYENQQLDYLKELLYRMNSQYKYNKYQRLFIFILNEKYLNLAVDAKTLQEAFKYGSGFVMKYIILNITDSCRPIIDSLSIKTWNRSPIIEHILSHTYGKVINFFNTESIISVMLTDYGKPYAIEFLEYVCINDHTTICRNKALQCKKNNKPYYCKCPHKKHSSYNKIYNIIVNKHITDKITFFKSKSYDVIYNRLLNMPYK